MNRGNYHSTHTALWDDPDFESLTPEAKLTFLALRTGSQANLACIYRLRISTLLENTGYPMDRLSKAIKELQDTHWIVYDGVVVWMRNGLKFNPQVSLTNPKQLSAVEKCLRGLPKSEITKLFCDYYKLQELWDSLSNGYREAIEGLYDSPKYQYKQEQEHKQEFKRGSGGEKKRKKSEVIESEKFEQFWEAYRYKKAIGDAEKAWNAALTQTDKPVTPDQLIEAAKFYSRTRKPEFIKYAATWLNKKCWLDESDPEPVKPHVNAPPFRFASDLEKEKKNDNPI